MQFYHTTFSSSVSNNSLSWENMVLRLLDTNFPPISKFHSQICVKYKIRIIEKTQSSKK